MSDLDAARRARDHRSDAEPRRTSAVRDAATCSDARSSRIRIRSPPNTTSRGRAAASNHYLFDMNRDYFALSQPRNAGTRARDARVVSAGRRRSARDGRQLHVLLRAAGGSDQSADHRLAAEVVRAVRPRQRGGVRQARLRVFRPRGLRRVLSGLRRFVADLSRRGRR